MSAEKQSTEIGLKTYREDVFLIISLKTVFENLHLVKSYNKTNLNIFVPCLWEKYRWGLTSFGQYRKRKKRQAEEEVGSINSLSTRDAYS